MYDETQTPSKRLNRPRLQKRAQIGQTPPSQCLLGSLSSHQEAFFPPKVNALFAGFNGERNAIESALLQLAEHWGFACVLWLA